MLTRAKGRIWCMESDSQLCGLFLLANGDRRLVTEAVALLVSMLACAELGGSSKQ